MYASFAANVRLYLFFLSSLILQINILAEQTMKYQNDVDTILTNHAITLTEIKHSINKTDASSSFKQESHSQCNYYIPRRRTSAALSETRTPWYPTYDDTQVVSNKTR